MLMVMIGIRKMLDLFFTRREMKILDDVMPEMSRRNQDELHELGSAEVCVLINCLLKIHAIFNGIINPMFLF